MNFFKISIEIYQGLAFTEVLILIKISENFIKIIDRNIVIVNG